MSLVGWIHPCSVEHQKARASFSNLTLLKKVAAIAVTIFAALATVWALGIGGMIAFRATVEKWAPPSALPAKSPALTNPPAVASAVPPASAKPAAAALKVASVAAPPPLPKAAAVASAVPPASAKPVAAPAPMPAAASASTAVAPAAPPASAKSAAPAVFLASASAAPLPAPLSPEPLAAAGPSAGPSPFQFPSVPKSELGFKRCTNRSLNWGEHLKREEADQLLQNRSIGTAILRRNKDRACIVSYRDETGTIIHRQLTKGQEEFATAQAILEAVKAKELIVAPPAFIEESKGWIGAVALEDAQPLLKAGEGLIRYSCSTGKYKLVEKKDDGSCIETEIDQLSFCQKLHQKQFQWFSYDIPEISFGNISFNTAQKRLQGRPVGTALIYRDPEEKQYWVVMKRPGEVVERFSCCGIGQQALKELLGISEYLSPADPEGSPFYYGNITSQEVEYLLKGAPNRSAIVRFSIRELDYILTLKRDDGTLFNYRFEGSSLERMLAYVEEEHYTPLSPPQGAPIPSKIEPKKSSYQRQVILNLGSGKSAAGLTVKATHRQLLSETIDLRVKQFGQTPNYSLLETLNDVKGRLYIIGHCSPGMNAIVSDEGIQMSAEDYADLLVTHTNLATRPSSDPPLRVSVVACYGGVDSGASKSFAYRLTQALAERHIQAEVLARTKPVSRTGHNPANYHKRVGGQHQAPGSKLLFRQMQGSDGSIKIQVEPVAYS